MPYFGSNYFHLKAKFQNTIHQMIMLVQEGAQLLPCGFGPSSTIAGCPCVVGEPSRRIRELKCCRQNITAQSHVQLLGGENQLPQSPVCTQTLFKTKLHGYSQPVGSRAPA